MSAPPAKPAPRIDLVDVVLVAGFVLQAFGLVRCIGVDLAAVAIGFQLVAVAVIAAALRG